MRHIIYTGNVPVFIGDSKNEDTNISLCMSLVIGGCVFAAIVLMVFGFVLIADIINIK